MIAVWLLAVLGCGDAPEATDPARDSADGCVTDETFYDARAAGVLAGCQGCHVEGGAAGSTGLVMVAGARGSVNLPGLRAWVASDPDAAARLREKPTGRRSHGGGVRLDVLDPAYAVLDELAARLETPGGCAHPGTPAQVCDGTVRPGSAPLRRLTASQYAETVRALLGVDIDRTIFPATTAAKGFRTWADLNVVSAAGAEQVQLAAEAAAAALDVDALLACGEGEDPRACARRGLLTLTERAFRRPLRQGEPALATRFLDAGLDVDTAVRMQVELLLQLPQVLYLEPTVDPAFAAPADAGQAVAPLTADALAARLSYYLTDEPPDDALRAAAASGALDTPEGRYAEARRLVADPRAARAVAALHRDWLRSWRLDTMTRDPALFAGDVDALAESALTELDLYTTEVVWSGTPTWDALFFGTQGWVDPTLAAIYGVPAPEGGWGLVELGPDRPGVLTRGAFLMGHAHAGASAPVLRGAWVLEQVLCEELTPPLNVNTTLPEPSEEAPTIRERLAQHAADPNCASCHVRIDPIGFAFEHYDAMGAWRERWVDGHPVDATGSLAEPAGDFGGASELLTLLATSERARGCYVRRWFEYAVGRPAEDADACALRALTERFAASGGNLRQLAADVVLTDAFAWAPVPDEAAADGQGGAR
jgi:hypothetical protein